MSPDRFALVCSELQLLLDSGVGDLDHVSSDIRQDGLPQNWVTDIPNLTGRQRHDMANMIPLIAPRWAGALRTHLISGS